MQILNAVELRKAKRYRLRVPALFIWEPQDGKLQSGQGVTRDINTSGIFVLTDVMPPVGALVQMEVVLPKLENAGPGMRLHGEGVVLRCERGDVENLGFSASAHFYPETADAVLSQVKVPWQVAFAGSLESARQASLFIAYPSARTDRR